MKKNLRTLGTILSLVAISSFAMTSCGEKTEETPATENAPAEATPEVAPETAPEVAPETAPTCDGAATCDGSAPAEGTTPAN